MMLTRYGSSASGTTDSRNAFSKMVSLLKIGRFAFPAIRRLMEYSAVIIMMPERRSRTFSLTWIRPVMHPASSPAAKLKTKVRAGCTPFKISMAVTAAPIGNVPSTDRSGKSRIL